MEILRFLAQNADALIALILALMIVAGIVDVFVERGRRRAYRADGYCANPTTKRGYCRRHPGPPGGRCGANHPSELLIPGLPVVSSVLLAAIGLGVVAWQPFARYVLPLLPTELQ